jgi:hypothetical protein
MNDTPANESPERETGKQVERFNFASAWEGRTLKKDPEGYLVRFSDFAALEAERDALDRALRLALSRAQVDRMLELQRQGFTGTIYEAWDRGFMPEEYKPAWELFKDERLRAVGETK